MGYENAKCEGIVLKRMGSSNSTSLLLPLQLFRNLQIKTGSKRAMGSYPSTVFVEEEWTRDKGEKNKADKRACPVDAQLPDNIRIVEGENQKAAHIGKQLDCEEWESSCDR